MSARALSDGRFIEGRIPQVNTDVNFNYIPPRAAPRYHAAMTHKDDDAFHLRLARAVRESGRSKRSIATAINVSPPALEKWLDGGGIEDDNLKRLGDELGIDFIELKYGPRGREAVDPVVEDLNALPEALRQQFRALIRSCAQTLASPSEVPQTKMRKVHTFRQDTPAVVKATRKKGVK